MIIFTLAFGAAAVLLLIRCIRYRLEIRSVCRQLDELAQGSHMELFVNHKDKAFVELCRRLNLVMKLNRQKERQYDKAQKRLKQNISALAHDIRTPLTSAAGYLQMGMECTDGEKRDRYLTVSQDRLEELKDMLEELFLYTKLSSSEFELSIQPVQILPLLGECLVGMYRQFEEKGVEPVVEFEDEGVRGMADEECLTRIFRNLIQNALLHGTGGITVKQAGSVLSFENPVAEDTQMDVEQIFDRFYKADGARRKGSSGLGLAIVREMTEKMGGTADAVLEQNVLKIRITLQQENTLFKRPE